MDSRHVDVAGLRLHCRAAGDEDAQPLVLVHGIGVSSTYLVPVGDELAARGFRVVAPDLPGSGGSDDPPGVAGIAGLADWLARFLDAVGIERAHAFANSMGCQVVLQLAAREPERLDRLILVGPTVESTARSFVRMGVRLALDSVREPPSLLGIIVADYLRFGPRRLLVTGRHALRDRPEATARHVLAPTLVVRGERDALLSRSWAQRLAAELPNGRFVEVPGHAHAAHYSAPALVGALAASFLRGEEAA